MAQTRTCDLEARLVASRRDIHLPHRLGDANLNRFAHQSLELRQDTPVARASRCLLAQVVEDVRWSGIVPEFDLHT